MAKPIELTADMEEELLASGGTTCPKCGGQNVSFNDREMEVGDDTIVRHAHCGYCDCSWNLTYKLMDVSGWEDPGRTGQKKAIELRKHTESMDSAYDSMHRKILEAVVADGQSARRIFYSAYEADEDDVPIDNLDKVAVEGTCKFFAEGDNGWGEGDDYESPEVENPTWLQVAVFANKMVQITGDSHHCFLEGVYPDSKRKGVYRFAMGS